MKFCAISDTHGELPKLKKSDVYIIAGDIIPLKIQRDFEKSIAWLAGPFQEWVLKLKPATPDKEFPDVVIVPGNHDFVFQRLYNMCIPDDAIFEIPNTLFQLDEEGRVAILIDDKYTVYDKIADKEINIYGTPWCPQLNNWAFYKDSNGLKESFDKIPDCDILVTHCPPKVGDQGVVLQNNWNFQSDFGCKELADSIYEREINWVISGHIHSGCHNVESFLGKKCITNYVNVSMKDENYNMTYKPFYFEL